MGRVWLIQYQGQVIGYVILTLGYSLEYGGRDAFIDEQLARQSPISALADWGRIAQRPLWALRRVRHCISNRFNPDRSICYGYQANYF